MYLCKANSTIYFLNQKEEEKWVNPLNIGNSQKLYPIDDYQNDLMAVPLYKTNYLSWGEEKFFADNRGGIHVFISLSEKEVGVNLYALNFKGALPFSHFFVSTCGSGW